MDKLLLALQTAWNSIKTQWPAIAMAVLSYEETKVKKAELEADQARLDAQREKNKSETLEKYATGSDADVLRRAIIDGGGADADFESTASADAFATEDRDPTKGNA